MRKAIACIVVIGAVVLSVGVPGVGAKAPKSGTVSCGTHGDVVDMTITPPLPGQTPSVKPSKVVSEGALTSCVGSIPALVIGRYSITGVIPKGHSCATEFTEDGDPESHVTLTRAKLKVKWIGVNGENFGTSSAKLASVEITEDDATGAYALEIVTNPISGGAFRHQVMTVDATIFNLGELATGCLTPGGSVSRLQFGPMTLETAP